MNPLSKFIAWFRSLPAKCQVTIGASVLGSLTIMTVVFFLGWNDLKEIESRVEATSRGQTEVIGKLSIDSIIAQDRPALQTLINGLKSLDSGLESIEISNQDGIVLASWNGQKNEDRTIHCSQAINYVGHSFGSIDTSWRYSHFAEPLIRAKMRSIVITVIALLLLIIGLAIILQYYMIHPLHYLEERIRSVSDPTVEPVRPRSFVSRELRSINLTFDDASLVLAEKARAEAEMLTERTRAEDAEAAAQAKMDFLSLMSHEIRTPLGAMMGFGQLLESANLNKEERGFLKNLNSSGSLLLHVINDILDLSKIEADGIEYESRALDPVCLIEEVMAMTSSLARQKGIHLECHSAGLDGWQVLGDEHRIKQVLVNLVGNAIKFTEKGEVRMQVEALDFTPLPDGRRPDRLVLRFEVADTGIGMTEEQCRQVFAPFSQADSTVSRRFGGTGLGLSVSNQMVKGMGGELNVNSKLGMGSVFYFELSMPTQELHGEEPVRESIAEPVKKAASGGLRILIAEDESMLRTLFEKIFTNFGCQVELVEDGKACTERLQQGIDFDVLFVDLHMPFVGGWEIARRLRDGEFGEKGKDLKLAIMSGDVFAEDEGKDLGVDAFISKPVELPRLQTFLKEISDQKALKDEIIELPVRPRSKARELRVLVVEDQPLNRSLMERLLSRQGIATPLAKDGVECLEFLETLPEIDAILMDWRMPRMDGVSATRKIRSGAIPAFTNIPIALVSAEVLNRPNLEGLDDVEFIPKPLDLDQLTSFLEGLRETQTAVALSG